MYSRHVEHHFRFGGGEATNTRRMDYILPDFHVVHCDAAFKFVLIYLLMLAADVYEHG